ncbi:MAG: hypothetical protein AB7Q97_16695 [Gammaproteobacteria bacterium]
MNHTKTLVAAACTALLAGCAVMPTGPGVMVLPGTGRSFDQFRGDDAMCRQFAASQVGGTSAGQAGQDAALRSAAVGTALGAAAGAAIAGGSGAATGAGAGAIAGTLTGIDAGNASAYGVQDRYDIAYIQCMYAQGHRVPVSGAFSAPGAPVTAMPAAPYPPASPPTPAYYPPPPPNAPPPAPAPR